MCVCVCSSDGFSQTTNPLVPASEIAESDPHTVRCVAYATNRTDAVNMQDVDYETVH